MEPQGGWGNRPGGPNDRLRKTHRIVAADIYPQRRMSNVQKQSDRLCLR